MTPRRVRQMQAECPQCKRRRAAAVRSHMARMHFSTAARIAADAFDTREDQLRMAAEAIGRGDFIACDIPEVPGAPA